MALVVKSLPASAGDIRNMGSILGLGRSPGGGNGNPLQYSCLRIPMDRGPWQATVHGVTKVGHDLGLNNNNRLESQTSWDLLFLNPPFNEVIS